MAMGRRVMLNFPEFFAILADSAFFPNFFSPGKSSESFCGKFPDIFSNNGKFPNVFFSVLEFSRNVKIDSVKSTESINTLLGKVPTITGIFPTITGIFPTITGIKGPGA